jgi:hypothetical protein
MEPSRRVRSGTWLVAAMVGFGLLLTAGLYTYWTLYTAPFRPIMESLAAKYPGSAPRVDGGKPRLDQAGERTLRIVMKSEFDPESSPQAEAFAHGVAEFVAATNDLSRFEAVEVHLFHGEPEDHLSQRSMRWSVAQLSGSGSGDGGRSGDE